MKRAQSTQESEPLDGDGIIEQSKSRSQIAGIIHKISLENFMCHDKLEIPFNEKINFIIGKNGSGKSAILTGVMIALGERASATNRGQSNTGFIKTGRPKAVVKVTLLNKGQGSYQHATFGDYITVERTIHASGSTSYKILDEYGKVITTKRQDLDRILSKMNLQVDNPVCILTQEMAKNFLHGNDPRDKYKLFERATQMDVMTSEFSMAEAELSRGKSCMREKIQSLEVLKAETKKWQEKKEWYEAVNEIHDRKAQLENMLSWAEVEELEKKAESALEKLNNQKEHIKTAELKIDEQKNKLAGTEEQYRTRNSETAEKAAEARQQNEALSEVEKRLTENKNRQKQLETNQMRQYTTEKRKLQGDKKLLTDAIERMKRDHGNSEYARREEKRLADLADLSEKMETLKSLLKVSEHQVEQLRGASSQLKNEANAARSEFTRLQRALDPKVSRLNELRKAGANAYSVFGDWVQPLLNRIKTANFRVKPKGPLGAHIKLKDSSWAPAVEYFFGGRLGSFICSCDEDAKLLNRLMDEVVRRGNKPSITTTRMTGEMYNVWNNKVHCDQEMESKDIHCLMDMLIIDDPDVANILIDLHSIEQILLFGDDRDAQWYLSDVNRVPHNCKSAITKGANTYFPDPNYRSYGGRAQKAARYLQTSVEEAIRNLEEEIEVGRQEVARAQQNQRELDGRSQRNDRELRVEETKLRSTRSELNSVTERIAALEKEKEPEPTDVAALEEDLLDVENKLAKLEEDHQEKMAAVEELKKEYQEIKQSHSEKARVVYALKAECDTLRDSMNQSKAKQTEIKDSITRLTANFTSMQGKLKNFETEYETAKEATEAKAAQARLLCPERVHVTKTIKSLKSELKQIQEQVAAQEKAYGSREHVVHEFLRHRKDYDRACVEVKNSQTSLKKMEIMAKKRKKFMELFRTSIMKRTHHVFQHLLKTRNFEGGIEFDSAEKTLNLVVTPPGREDSSQPTPKRARTGKSGGTDIRTLSGGERSFTTVCFIISLWDAIESPFRILDEFDVFMDHVNRTISMDLLIYEARHNNAGRQYIFLTPLGLDEKRKHSSDISVLKMFDPERRELDGEEMA